MNISRRTAANVQRHSPAAAPAGNNSNEVSTSTPGTSQSHRMTPSSPGSMYSMYGSSRNPTASSSAPNITLRVVGGEEDQSSDMIRVVVR
jgi:hypothetical protein